MWLIALVIAAVRLLLGRGRCGPPMGGRGESGTIQPKAGNWEERLGG